MTSIVGIVAYPILQTAHGGAIAPDWALGAFLGAGGFLGSYLGARLQRRLPEHAIRRLLGLIACLVAARYIQSAGPARPHRRSRAHSRANRTPPATRARPQSPRPGHELLLPGAPFRQGAIAVQLHRMRF